MSERVDLLTKIAEKTQYNRGEKFAAKICEEFDIDRRTDFFTFEGEIFRKFLAGYHLQTVGIYLRARDGIVSSLLIAKSPFLVSKLIRGNERAIAKLFSEGHTLATTFLVKAAAEVDNPFIAFDDLPEEVKKRYESDKDEKVGDLKQWAYVVNNFYVSNRSQVVRVRYINNQIGLMKELRDRQRGFSL